MSESTKRDFWIFNTKYRTNANFPPRLPNKFDLLLLTMKLSEPTWQMNRNTNYHMRVDFSRKPTRIASICARDRVFRDDKLANVCVLLFVLNVLSLGFLLRVRKMYGYYCRRLFMTCSMQINKTLACGDTKERVAVGFVGNLGADSDCVVKYLCFCSLTIRINS